MRREDLFNAIGNVDNQRLDRCEKRRNPNLVTGMENSNMKEGKYIKPGRGRRIWMIAAIIVLMSLLMGSAIAELVSMRVEKIQIAVPKPGNSKSESEDSGDIHGEDTTAATQIHEGEKVHFEEVHDQFLELGPYYPQKIPEGYTMTFVSEGAPLQNQRIDYENGTGKRISFWIYIGDPASNVEIYDIVSKTDVEISGQRGILYEQSGGNRTLVWLDDTLGYGYALRTNDGAVDLAAMAESTGEGEPLVPSRSESTVKAVAELGDYVPAYLPDGYRERGTMGSPLAEGSGWYSYVRKWFINPEANAQIYLEYETYRIVTEDGYTDDAKTVCSFHIPGCNILKDIMVGEEVEIGGMFGIASKNDVAWADPERHVVYHLYSETVTGDELLKVAQSITQET